MHRNCVAALVAATLLSGPAFAAGEIPGSPSTKANIDIGTELTRGMWEVNPDSDRCKVKLTKDQDYAIRFIAIDFSAPATATLRNGQRKALKSADYNHYGDAGFEYRATETATYFLEAKGEWDPDAPGQRSYAVSVSVDCKDAPTTKCSLEVGKKKNGISAWVGDHDRFAVTLDKTKVYTFAVDAPGEDTACSMQLLDGTGSLLVEVRYSIGDPAVIKNLPPKASGKHYLRVSCDLVEDYGSASEVLVTVG